MKIFLILILAVSTTLTHAGNLDDIRLINKFPGITLLGRAYVREHIKSCKGPLPVCTIRLVDAQNIHCKYSAFGRMYDAQKCFLDWFYLSSYAEKLEKTPGYAGPKVMENANKNLETTRLEFIRELRELDTIQSLQNNQ